LTWELQKALGSWNTRHKALPVAWAPQLLVQPLGKGRTLSVTAMTMATIYAACQALHTASAQGVSVLSHLPSPPPAVLTVQMGQLRLGAGSAWSLVAQ
jgi:hypothetical protein